jgi:hypothetical protein
MIHTAQLICFDKYINLPIMLNVIRFSVILLSVSLATLGLVSLC